MKQITGFHFSNNTLRNGQPIPNIGVWLKHDGPIEPCVSGLHASQHPYDALKYAPGNLLHKVILRDDLKSHESPIDKWVGRERKIIASVNAETLLRNYARWCALSVIHLWDPPAVVKEYLETGKEELRDAAWAAARDAAWAAAQDAAWAAWAAWAAAQDAARDAAISKQRDQFKSLVTAAFKNQTTERNHDHRPSS